VIWVGESMLYAVTGMPPKTTPLAPANPVPVITTWLPPAGSPVPGDTLVTVGGAGWRGPPPPPTGPGGPWPGGTPIPKIHTLCTEWSSDCPVSTSGTTAMLPSDERAIVGAYQPTIVVGRRAAAGLQAPDGSWNTQAVLRVGSGV
jgi:hypothetical protein